MAVSRPPIPRLPGGPDPAEPVPRSPVNGFDIAACARITAKLVERAEPRAAVLAGANLDELHWLEIEKTWMLRLATAALQGDLSLGAEYDEAFAATSAGTEPALPLEEYATIVASLEAGRDPVAAATAAKLSIATFGKLQRAWTARLAADPALMESFRAMVAAKRPA